MRVSAGDSLVLDLARPLADEVAKYRPPRMTEAELERLMAKTPTMTVKQLEQIWHELEHEQRERPRLTVRELDEAELCRTCGRLIHPDERGWEHDAPGPCQAAVPV